jgi:hypothetical protein
VNVYQALGGGLTGALHLPPAMESRLHDGQQVVLTTGAESGTFTVDKTIIVAGPKAACIAQVSAPDGWS